MKSTDGASKIPGTWPVGNTHQRRSRLALALALPQLLQVRDLVKACATGARQQHELELGHAQSLCEFAHPQTLPVPQLFDVNSDVA